jgi:hypothetical protein
VSPTLLRGQGAINDAESVSSLLGSRPRHRSQQSRRARLAVRTRQDDRRLGQNFIACDRDQELLLPPSLREWLPEDHLAWFVLDAVAELDLETFYGAYRRDGWGAAAHDPEMMVSLLVYACATPLVGRRSSGRGWWPRRRRSRRPRGTSWRREEARRLRPFSAVLAAHAIVVAVFRPTRPVTGHRRRLRRCRLSVHRSACVRTAGR